MSKIAVPGGNGKGINSENINSGWKLAWLERIADHQMLTHLDVSVATYLSRRFKKDRGTTIASYDKIAKTIGCHRVTAIRSVGRLVKHGFVVLESRGNSRKLANEYVLCQSPTSSATSSAKLPELVAQTDHQLVAQTDSLSTVGFSTEVPSLREGEKTMDEKEGELSSPSGARSPEESKRLGEEERAKLIARYSKRVEAPHPFPPTNFRHKHV